nr:MAG: RNA-dependent RNA polymerase [Porcine picobirnavirus]
MSRKVHNLRPFYINGKQPRGLRPYLSRVEKGFDEDIRTPFAGGKDIPVPKILDEWMDKLESIKASWPGLWEYENDLAKKVGPMSIMKPLKDRLVDVESYYESVPSDSAPLENSSVTRTLDELAKLRMNGLFLRTPDRTVQEMRLSTSSGCPEFTKRRNISDETLKIVKDFWVRAYRGAGFTSNIDKFLLKSAAIIGWRGQEGGPDTDDTKQRVVWMFPFGVNIAELQSYQSVVAAAKACKFVPAWVSQDEVDYRMTELFDTKDDSDPIICTDFTKFDQHFNQNCSDVSRQVLSKLFMKDDKMELWLNQIFPIKYEIPIILKERLAYAGDHGMASGSGGTNADETLCHRTLQHEAAMLAGVELNQNSQCLGDDGVLSYKGADVDHVVKCYTSHGLDMNPDKQEVSATEATYLRRWYNVKYRPDGYTRGVYSTCRALGRLCRQERFYDPDDWGEKMVVLRYLSIIENVKWHPLRDQFADFCIERDFKTRLGLNIPGFLDRIEYEARKANDKIKDFMGYNRSVQGDSGISNWWIVQYLKSKR